MKWRNKLIATFGGFAAFLAASVSFITISDRFRFFEYFKAKGQEFKSSLLLPKEPMMTVALSDEIREFVGDYCVYPSDPGLQLMLDVEKPNDGLKLSIRLDGNKATTLLTTTRGFAVTDVLDARPSHLWPAKGLNKLFFPMNDRMAMEFGPAPGPGTYRVVLRSLDDDNSIVIGPELRATECQ